MKMSSEEKHKKELDEMERVLESMPLDASTVVRQILVRGLKELPRREEYGVFLRAPWESDFTQLLEATGFVRVVPMPKGVDPYLTREEMQIWMLRDMSFDWLTPEFDNKQQAPKAPIYYPKRKSVAK